MGSKSLGVVKRLQLEVTVDTASIGANEAMHDNILEFANAFDFKKSGEIVGVTVTDEDGKTNPVALHFFSNDMPNSTITKNAVPDIDDGDLVNSLGHIDLVAGDFEPFLDNSVGNVVAELPVVGNKEDKSLYAVLVTKATVTYATATALTLNVFIKQD